MTPSRLKKLEARVASIPCRACGLTGAAPPRRSGPRLYDAFSGAEQAALVRMVKRVIVPCVQCGRGKIDLTRATDDEKREALAIFRGALTKTYGAP